MEDLQSRLTTLRTLFDTAAKTIGLQALVDEAASLEAQTNKPGFWDQPSQAQEISKKLARLTARVSPWLDIQQSMTDTEELLQLDDPNIKDELEETIQQTETAFNALKEQLKYSGKYDEHAALLTISAGAGGTDAMDWAEMLERMYLRWCEASAMKTDIIDRSPGEEAGIKSVTIEIDGEFAYAKLKGEHGVHRLVRLSPFNADGLRQTSFAKVEVVPIIDTPDEIVIDQSELKIDVYRSGGKGGQSVNTTDSAVRITHIPTGIVVAIQNERSQLQNKEKAMQIVRSKLAQLKLEQHKEKLSELKGPNEQAAWGNQIRNYVLHPYKLVKDSRSGYETTDVDGVLGGGLNELINAYLNSTLRG